VAPRVFYEYLIAVTIFRRGNAMRFRLIFAGFVSLLFITGCETSTEPQFYVMKAHVKWLENEPSSYSYHVVRNAFFDFLSDSGPAEVVVRNGVVVSRTFVKSGAPVPLTLWDQYSTIDRLFGHILEARRSGAVAVNVTYDPRYGFPTLISVDQAIDATDDGYSFVASNFRVR
jgi:hypothetical protein